MSEVLLQIGARAYGGWKSVEIIRSIETISGGFTLGVTERWPGQQVVAAIAPDDDCGLAVDGETIITGHVDNVAPEYDANHHEVKVRGRDATGDLVDCSLLDKFQWLSAATILDIAGDICKPFGIKVSSTVPPQGAFINFTWQPGETVFEMIDRLAATEGVLPTSDGKGGLVFTRAGTAGAQAKLKLGNNILGARGHFSGEGRFSRYVVLGQSSGSAFIDPASSAGGRGEAFDPGVHRYRPLVILPTYTEAGSIYQSRAQWEATVRLGRAWRAVITVQGWRDDAGALWKPNTTVPVEDEFLGIKDTLLIPTVKLNIDERGETADLTVTRREAFDIKPLPEFIDGYDRFPRGP